MRIPLAISLQSRDGRLDRDAKVLNGLIEPKGEDSAIVRKRPGVYPIVLGKAGVAQAIMSWNGLRTVQDDYLNKGTLVSVGTGTNLSPTLQDLPFSWNSTASGVATPLMMIKNRTQAWSVNRAGTASAITYGGTMGSYTYNVISITRASTIATVTTAQDTGLVIGDTVTIAGANEVDYNGAQTVTGVTLGSYTPYANIVITVTRSGTTATATTASGDDHGLVSGSSYTISSLTGDTESQYLGSKTITTSGGSTFTYTVTTTAPTAIGGTWNSADKATAVTLSGGSLTATFATAAGAYAGVRGTVSKSAGVWAMEFTVGVTEYRLYFGVATSTQSLTATPEGSANAWVYYTYSEGNTGIIRGPSTLAYCDPFVAGDKIGVVFDGDANTVTFYKNGVYQGAITGLTGTVYPFGMSYDLFGLPSATMTANFAGSFTYSYDQPVTPATGTILVTRPAVTVNPTFTYTVGGSPATPATGTITAAVVGGTVPGIAYIDGYFCVMDLNGTIWNSDSDDPTTWDALDFIIAQNEPGKGRAIAKSQNYLVAFKEWSTEFFYNAANQSGSPFSPVVNGFTQVGCASGESVASLDNALLWVSQSRQAGRGVYLMSGIEQVKVSTPDVDRILNAADLTTVHAYCVRLDGHSLYVLTVVESDFTLVYDLDSKAWTQWSSLTLGSSVSVTSITLSSNGRTATVVTATAHGFEDGQTVAIAGAGESQYNTSFNISYISTTSFAIEVSGAPSSPATGTILAYPYTESYFKFTKQVNHEGRDLLLHESDGYIYEMRPLWFFDSVVPIHFLVRTARLDGGTMGRKRMASIAIVGESDEGLFTANSSVLMLRWSDDDTETFSAYRGVDVNDQQPQLRRCGAFRRRTIEAKNSENCGMRIEALEIRTGD